MILTCTCKHAYQDTRYGANQRVHNWAPKSTATGGWRCVVCGKIKAGAAPTTTAKK